ncbi:MAG TPA: GNAT family N-acetyltransferase [Symbiobacteriaceae bacterium]|nr:GNAT family N-acetyltransferase [Symbiobacteriaceae bacterium]
MAVIRSMTQADYASVAAMARDAALEALVGRPAWETEADVAAEAGGLQGGTFLVAADDDGRLVGVAGFRLTEQGEAEIYGPLVTAEGSGIGAWLEARVVTLAQARGAQAFSMLIGVANRAGAAWAEWRGYQRDTETPELLLTWLYPGDLRPVPPVPGALVRPAAGHDAPRIQAMLEEGFPLERSIPADWTDNCWLVEQHGQVAGFLCLNQTRVDHLYIDPAYRRQGLGATLLSAVVQRLWQAEPNARVAAAVPLDDAAPLSLFRRLGFRREIPVAKWMKR